MPGHGIKRGDIVLVPFPFTNLQAEKVRPAVIVSADPRGLDVVVAFISSVVHEEPPETDFMFSSDHPDFAASGLKRTSVFKMKKLLTVEKAKLVSRLGRVRPPIQAELDRRLTIALGLNPESHPARG